MPTPSADIGSLIVRSPEICGGRPRLAGTGVSVSRVVGWYKLGWTAEQIAEEIEHLNLAQVYAALTYYHANRDEIEASIQSEQDEADKLEQSQSGTT